MSTRLIVCLLIAVSAICGGNVVGQAGTVTFPNQNGGLEWPLPDVTNPGLLLRHGTHCFEVINEELNETDSMSAMHQQHCRRVMENVVRFFRINPSYQVNEWICKTLDDHRAIRSFCYKACFGEKKRRRGKRDIESAMVHEKNPDEAFTQLAASNFGHLLMKNYTDPTTLTRPEMVYLQNWFQRSSIAMAAAAVYCRVKGDVSMIRDALGDQHSRLQPHLA
jgi:hypothetical protein